MRGLSLRLVAHQTLVSSLEPFCSVWVYNQKITLFLRLLYGTKLLLSLFSFWAMQSLLVSLSKGVVVVVALLSVRKLEGPPDKFLSLLICLVVCTSS